MALYSLSIGSKELFAGSVCLLAICILINLPLMLEQISKRVGSNLLNTATGLVYFTSQLLTASLTYVFGLLMDSKTKASSINTIIVGVSLFGVCFVLSFILYLKRKSKFRGFSLIMKGERQRCIQNSNGANYIRATLDEFD